MNAPTLETARLTLRAFVSEDAEDVFEACKNPILGHDAGWPPHESVQDSLAYINEIAPVGLVWGILEKGTRKVIGSIGFLPDPRTPEDPAPVLLGYWLAEDHWNKGYITEASKRVIDWLFAETGAERIVTSHFLFNKASQRVIEKCGFTPTCIGPWPTEEGEPEQDVQWYELVRGRFARRPFTARSVHTMQN